MNYKIEDLEAASAKVISVHPERSLTEAATKMALHDFSQLPVMSNPRKIDGVISWKTIGVVENFGSKKELVKDYMDKNVTILNGSDNFLDSVKDILDKEYIFIRIINILYLE